MHPLVLALALCASPPVDFAPALDDTVTQVVDDTGDDVHLGSVVGIVVYTEKPPKERKITVGSSRRAECVKMHGAMDLQDRTLLVHETGGLANVVVTISVPGVAAKVPEEPIVMDNRGCRFEPHVLVVPAGGTVRVRNSDDTSHNIHTSPRKNTGINMTVAAGSYLDCKFKRKEAVPVSCDIHPWMKGWIFVSDTPFTAVTDEHGAFEIVGLPPGAYDANLWHESLGRMKAQVEIEADGMIKVEWKFAPPKKKRGRSRR